MLRIATLLGLSFLVACSMQPGPGISSATHSDPWLIERFALKGRIGLRGSGSASIRWNQAGDYYRIVLFGPFGSGRIEIEGDPKQAAWRDQNGNFASTREPEAFLQEKLGWSLPITSLRFWVRGLPAPDDSIERFEVEKGQLRSLKQNGWLLRLDRYQTVGDVELPGRLVLENNQQKLLLLVGEWILN